MLRRLLAALLTVTLLSWLSIAMTVEATGPPATPAHSHHHGGSDPCCSVSNALAIHQSVPIVPQDAPCGNGHCCFRPGPENPPDLPDTARSQRPSIGVIAVVSGERSAPDSIAITDAAQRRVSHHPYSTFTTVLRN
jgi:hypothetical protein